MTEPRAFINAVAGAVPPNDVHRLFIDWGAGRIGDERQRGLFVRMAERSGIRHRWSVLPRAAGGGSPIEPGGFYHRDLPSTGKRMGLYAEAAPKLALKAIAALNAGAILGITHLVVASCTGFVAPGIDQIIAAELGLSPQVERTLVGFMGCYAAVSALRLAHHIVRSEPQARVLVVTVELCTLQVQRTQEIDRLLAMFLFGDGAAAAIVTGDGAGLALGEGISAALEDSEDLITWQIGDTGFRMRLSGEVPGRIAAALADPGVQQRITGGQVPSEIEGWAVHAGGRSILDAVEKGLHLPPTALDESREVLRMCGNMSSSTLMFALERILRKKPASGVALAFGPGLAMEGFRFGWSDAG